MLETTEKVRHILAHREDYHVEFVTPLPVLSSERREYTGQAVTKMLIQHVIDYHREYRANELKRRGEWTTDADISDEDHLVEFIALHHAVIVKERLTIGTIAP